MNFGGHLEHQVRWGTKFSSHHMGNQAGGGRSGGERGPQMQGSPKGPVAGPPLYMSAI